MVGSLCQHIDATSAVGNTHSSRFKLIPNTVRGELILCALYVHFYRLNLQVHHRITPSILSDFPNTLPQSVLLL